MSRSATVWCVVALVVIGALPGVLLGDIVAERTTLVAGAVSALAAALVAVAVLGTGAGSSRRPLAFAALVLGGAALAVGGAAIWPDSSGRNAVSAAADALIRGWSALASSPPGSPAEPRVIVPVAVASWLATAAAVTVALRSTSRLVPLVPGTIAIVLAAVAAGSFHANPVPVAAVFVVAAIAMSVARQPRAVEAPRRGASPERRNYLAPLLVAVGAAAVAVVAGPLLADGSNDDPFDPRDHLTPSIEPADAENPLDLVSSRLRNADDVLFTLRAPEALPTRLLVLDTFDGANWSTSGLWARVGAKIPVPVRSLAEVRTVAASIEVPTDGLDGPFLPTVGDTRTLDGVPAITDRVNGSLALVDGTVAGRSFAITAEIASIANVDLARLNGLGIGDAPAALVLPETTPQVLRDAATSAVQGYSSAVDKAKALDVYFKRGGFTLDEEQRGGHTFADLIDTLGRTYTGISEQYATAFAVFGRIVGLPTRVVIGFNAGDETAPGEYSVTGADAVVWPEVLFDDIGWVRFDPTPQQVGGSRTEDAEVTAGVGDREVPLSPPVTEPSEPEPEPAGGADTPNEPPADDSDSPGLAERLRDRLIVVVPVALVALALCCVVWVLAAKRRRTKRRRGAAGASARTRAAWHDVLDRITEIASTRPDAFTVDEHVATYEDSGASLAGMRQPVTVALYGMREATDDEATAAWTTRDEFVRAQRAAASRRLRLRRGLSLTTLRRPAGADAGERANR